MTKVIGVRFRTAGKIYFFAPGKFDIRQGDNVIVETARGVEFGRVVAGPRRLILLSTSFLKSTMALWMASVKRNW